MKLDNFADIFWRLVRIIEVYVQKPSLAVLRDRVYHFIKYSIHDRVSEGRMKAIL